MDDTISRQAAIDAINKYACNTQRIYEAIRKLPSAQPYTEAEIQKMQELEQAELQKAYECGRASAQPDIVYCKECSRYSNGYCHHPETYSICVDANHFCGYAERREE